MNIKSAAVLLGLSSFILSEAIQADGILAGSVPERWHPVIAVGGGFSSTTNLGKYYDFPIVNPLTDEFYIYTPQSKNQTRGMFEVFLGAEHSLYSNLLFQGGLAYAQTGKFNSKGTFLQGVDPQSADQYTYQFKVLTRQLMAQTKFMYSNDSRAHPYLLVGLGGSINSATDYSTNVPPTLTYTRMYANKTTTSFAYRLGVGVDIDVAQHMRFGLAYRFANLGGFYQSGSAAINDQPVEGSLSQSNLYANEALVQLTYIL